MPSRAAGNQLTQHFVQPVHRGDPQLHDLLPAGGAARRISTVSSGRTT
jgi:hypothetical protein